LAAALSELSEVGFANLTMESVADRAQTGVAVLYRRWANKDELVIAAIQQERYAHPIALPDTGTLRDDLIGLLTALSKGRAGVTAMVVAASFSGLLAATGATPAQVRDRLLDDGTVKGEQIVYQRAHDRGEIDLERVPPAVLALPFELTRHDMVMNLRPLRPARVRAIVDELVLPLMSHYQTAQAC
jgi:AcrR family transcriptional regulator